MWIQISDSITLFSFLCFSLLLLSASLSNCAQKPRKKIMDEEMEMEEEIIQVYEVFEIDFDYEFDATRFFDFTRPESEAESRFSESWFGKAPSYPPSRKPL